MTSDGHINLKRCQECNRPMVIRKNRYTEEQFLACIGFPSCRHTEPEPEYLKLRRQGVTPLPGFE